MIDIIDVPVGGKLRGIAESRGEDSTKGSEVIEETNLVDSRSHVGGEVVNPGRHRRCCCCGGGEVREER